ncbi:uncharacterized [Tachysurus ichikawai]
MASLQLHWFGFHSYVTRLSLMYLFRDICPSLWSSSVSFSRLAKESSIPNGCLLQRLPGLEYRPRTPGSDTFDEI